MSQRSSKYIFAATTSGPRTQMPDSTTSVINVGAASGCFSQIVGSPRGAPLPAGSDDTLTGRRKPVARSSSLFATRRAAIALARAAMKCDPSGSEGSPRSRNACFIASERRRETASSSRCSAFIDSEKSLRWSRAGGERLGRFRGKWSPDVIRHIFSGAYPPAGEETRQLRVGAFR